MKKFIPSFLTLIFFVLIIFSCTNLMDEVLPSSELSFNIGEDTSRYIGDTLKKSRTFTDDTELNVTCSLNKGEEVIKTQNVTSSIANLDNVSFTFSNIPFYSNYIINISIKYKDYVIFTGNSSRINLSENNISPEVDIDIEPHLSTITYNTNGGTMPSVYPKEYFVTSNIPLPRPSLYGKTFVHWTLDDGTIITELGKNNYLGDITLNAIWDINYCTVKYITNTDTPKDNIRIPYGNSLTSKELVTNLSKPEYEFDGWYVDGQKIDVGYKVTKDITLTAHWTKQGYTSSVTFTPDGGAIDLNDTVELSTKDVGATIYYAISPSTTYKTYSNPIKIDNNQNTTITAYAKIEGKLPSPETSKTFSIKTYTVFFDNANHGTKPQDITGLVRGSTLTTGQLKPLEEKGFDFLGWYVGDVKVDEKYPIVSNITLVALWQEQDALPPVTFSTPTGNIDINETVSLSCINNPDACIYYTLDKSTPNPSNISSSSSTKLYDNIPISISKEMTIKAIAVKNGMKDSPLSEVNYTIKTYNITFNNGGHGTAPSNIPNVNAAYKIPENKLTPLTEEGWIFKGYVDQHGNPIDINYQIKEDVTITALWEVITYNITYNNCSEAEIINNNPNTYTVEDNITLTDPINKPGHRFLGWYNSNNFIDANKVSRISNSTGNITLYANWQPIDYTITYEPGNGDVINQKTLSYNSNLTPECLPTISKPGHTFEGWYIDTHKVDETYQIKSNITLTAKWTIHTHTITYVTNAPDSLPVKTVDYGYVLTSSDLPRGLKKTQHDFDNWYINGSVANEGYVVTDNITLTAKWTKWTTTESVSFSNTTEVDYEDNITLSCEIGSTIYYTLDNSNPLTSSSKKTVTPTTGSRTTVNIPITADTTIKAYSTSDHKIDSAVIEKIYTVKTYTVTFDSKGHGTAPAPLHLHKNEKISEATLTQTTAPGYNLKGWFKDPELTNQWISGTDQMLTSHITLYANWELITYSITYKTEDGTLITNTDESNPIRHSSINAPTSFSVENTEVPLYPPAKDGYRGQWHKDTARGEIVDSIIVQSSNLNNITLVAGEAWTPITYTIKYDPNGAAGEIQTETVTYDTRHPLMQNPYTRSGFEFQGWQSGSTGGSPIRESYNDCKNQGASITVYAKWYDIAPEALSNVQVAQGTKQVTISWTKPIEEDIDYIEVSYQDTKKTESIKTSNTSDNTKTSITISNLSLDTKYDFTITPIDKGGNRGPSTIKSSFANRESAPQQLDTTMKPATNYISKNSPTLAPPSTYSTSEWRYVEYGWWPQTLADDTVTIETETTNTWTNVPLYKGDDNNWYVKLDNATPFPATTENKCIKTFSNGEEVVERATYYFKMEPIIWRVLDEQYEINSVNKGTLLMGDEVIVWKEFSIGDNTDYFSCDLHNYLNGTFYNQAFAVNIMNPKIVPTNISSTTSVSGGQSVNVFIPNANDMKNSAYGFNSFEYGELPRNRYVKDWALATGCMKYKGDQANTKPGVTPIYLRGINDASGQREYIDETGALSYTQNLRSKYGIIPMIVVENTVK